MAYKILYFAPVATKENPTISPFITQRIAELKKHGHEVVILQFGRLNINSYFDISNLTFFNLLPKILHLLKFFIKRNKLIEYKTSFVSYKYYENLSFNSYKQFAKWFEKNNFSFIHVHFLWFAKQLPYIKRNFNIRYFITLHGSDIHEITEYDKDEISSALLILNNAECCFFVSSYLLDHIKKLGYVGNNAKVIYNGIDFNIFSYIGEKEKSDNYTLGFVGHLNFIKRADSLPIILFLVRKVLPNTRLLIVGSEDGDLLPYIKSQICRLELQKFVDIVPQVLPDLVANYMREMDVLLLPSRNDGFGCVALEAQACGIGVIGSANGGIPEAIGKNGICISETENFISDYVDAIINYLKTKHNSEEISNSVRKFSWKNCIDQENSVYKSFFKD
ncbi:MAG: glycosyltransferase [Spirochaetaceae bacterium]|nr:glycosyltransferase [Spirochaetaceae bacterium]